MNVLVAGSHGFIGSALVARLRAAGHEVVRLVRSGPGGEREVSWSPSAGSVDRRRLRQITEGFGPIDGVVNLAGAGIADGRWTAARRQHIRQSRLEATGTLAALVVELDPVPAVLVSGSAIGIYGNRGDEVLTEDSAPGQGFLADLCRQWEAAAEPVVSAGVRLVTLRTGMVLSPGGGALGRQLPLFRLGLGGRLGDGRQYVSWITLDDEVSVIERALTDGRLRGPLNSVAPNPVTNADFTRALARTLHRPGAARVPRLALAAAFGPELVSEAILASQRVQPVRLLSAEHQFAQPILAGALAALFSGR